MKTCVLVTNLELQTTSFEPTTSFDGKLKVTPVQFFILDFNLLSSELDNFTFKVLYTESFYVILLKQNKVAEHAVGTIFTTLLRFLVKNLI